MAQRRRSGTETGSANSGVETGADSPPAPHHAAASSERSSSATPPDAAALNATAPEAPRLKATPTRPARTRGAAVPARPAYTRRPTPAELTAAHGTTIHDLLAPGLRVVFCGINPGLWSAAVDAHFARPGNRFWPALHDSGFTPELLGPARQAELLPLGLGLTNVASRATARADELTDEEIREGGQVLVAKLERLRPRWIAILGIGAYRTAFGRKKAVIGPQPEPLAHTKVWVLPNPSGLNALWTTPKLVDAFRAFRLVTEASDECSYP